jgi:hypothetical protein
MALSPSTHTKQRLLIILVYPTIIILLLFILDYIISQTSTTKWQKDNVTIEKLINNKWQIQTTPLLLRKGEKLLPKASGTKRILIIGDSFVFGDGYTNSNLTWWSTLHNNLLMSGYNIELIAAGYNGMSAYEEYRLLKDTNIIAEVNPDLITFGWVMSNDLESKGEEPCMSKKSVAFVVCTSKNPMVFDLKQSNIYPKEIRKTLETYIPNIISTIDMHLIEKYQYDDTFNKTIGYTRNSHYDATVTPESFAWNEEFFFKPFSEFIASTNIPTFYIITDVLPPDGTDPNLHKVTALFDRYDIRHYEFFQAASALPKLTDSSKYYINPLNSHPSHFTTSFYANQTQRVLEADYAHILGQKNTFEKRLVINDATPWDIDLTKLSENQYEFTYPSNNLDEGFLHMPIDKQFIKLNFQFPVEVKKITIHGDNINKIELWSNCLNTDGWDDQTYYPLGAQTSNFHWTLNQQNITSLNIHADIKDGHSQKIQITINP